MTKTAQDFARDLTLIVDTSAHALTALTHVLEQQQQSILALASKGSVPAPPLAGIPNAFRPPAAEAAASAPATTPAAPTAASAETASPAAPSPEALLAQAEKTAQALLENAPELALSHVYHASAHAVSLALLNTVAAQQHLNIVAQAVVTRGAANQLSTPASAAPAASGKSTSTADSSPPPAPPSRSRAR
ncbi:RebB family R body protein [Hyalangium minutum]|uniref:Uncharacterized protein n=1 Tax=Hyalangium minutum TaxID=394096 RepID=A0A085WQJ9_9BACT|nr:RebB family R body protein [Hyalangium minutum]KFE69962.1 hypothetical protein DB31_5004 [Hyalangium minutum]